MLTSFISGLAVISLCEDGVQIREDDPKTKCTTSRTLRSGRAVDMVKYYGLIYRYMLHRLRNVEYLVEIFSREGMCGMSLKQYFIFCRESRA